ncbi:PDZ domain-containing protein [Halopelagius inordinatus]|uniref:PDZ domain-containing protein n=1 Tax=Halopelagius inordinatus TaxID=553467 RepID=A0A1I2TEU9_9EURY|nr:site-2 protease family protein [Halopelagius inordinatus]SFG63463.1 PDZ domain-containing protein [Halopelagius inordinatus]
MNTLLWVLVGLLAYSFAAFFLRRRGLLPSSVKVQGPFTTIHTKRGRDLIDWIATPKRFWRAWSNLGVGAALVIMFGMFFFLLVQGVFILRNPPAPSAVNQPQNFLVIPGVNDFLPLSVAPEIVFGLLVGLVVHEGGHGILCRVEGIDIESMGVFLFTVLPLGAFVEPDEESQRDTDRGGRTRMFAAGVMNNFAVTAIAFALLFGPIIASIGVAPGVAVAGSYDGSPAAAGGIGQSDRITAIEGTPVTNESTLDRALFATDARSVQVELDGGESAAKREARTVTVERSLVVAGTVAGNPANLSVSGEDDPIEVQAVNGTPVYSQRGFSEAVGEDRFAELTTSRGTVTIPVGAYVTSISSNGPVADAGVPDDSFVVTAVDGTRVTSSTELGNVLDDIAPGETVPVELYHDGSLDTYDVTLGENPRDGGGFLGVNLFGTSGLLLTDFGVQSYPAGTYVALLGGDGGPDAASLSGAVADSPLSAVYVSLILPLASLVLGIPNFPGFTQSVFNFYTVGGGPFGFLGTGVFLLANVCFWAAWINLQLGLFNCIPGYPLDGGRILRTSVEAVVSRLPVDEPYPLVRTITTSVGVTMLLSLLVLIFGPTVLGG